MAQDGRNIPMEEEEQALRWLITSPSWNEVVRPKIEERMVILYNKLIDPTQKRKEEVSDDYIRGQIAVIRWLVAWPAKRQKALQDRLREVQAFNVRQNGESATDSHEVV